MRVLQASQLLIFQSTELKKLSILIELLAPENRIFQSLFLIRCPLTDEQVENVYWELNLRGITAICIEGSEGISKIATGNCSACREEHELNSLSCYEVKIEADRELRSPILLPSLFRYLNTYECFMSPAFSINLKEKLDSRDGTNLQKVLEHIWKIDQLKLSLVLHYHHDYIEEMPCKLYSGEERVQCIIDKFKGCIDPFSKNFLLLLRDRTNSNSNCEISFTSPRNCYPRYLLGISGVVGEYSYVHTTK